MELVPGGIGVRQGKGERCSMNNAEKYIIKKPDYYNNEQKGKFVLFNDASRAH